jgi:hypothetical protein
MSIEALKDMDFSIKSDVWSYGIDKLESWKIKTGGNSTAIFQKQNYLLDLLINRNLTLGNIQFG